MLFQQWKNKASCDIALTTGTHSIIILSLQSFGILGFHFNIIPYAYSCTAKDSIIERGNESINGVRWSAMVSVYFISMFAQLSFLFHLAPTMSSLLY